MAQVQSMQRTASARWFNEVTKTLSVVPFPLAMILVTLIIGVAYGMDDSKLIATFNKGFGYNMGYFALILVSSFFLAAAISKGEIFQVGRLGVLISPFTGAGMVCPDTSYATLAPIAPTHRKGIAVGSYAGFKLMIPAGPLIIGVGLSIDVNRPGFAILGFALMIPVVLAGLLWLKIADRDNSPESAAPVSTSTGPKASALKRLFPLYCLAFLIIVGLAADFRAWPTLKFLTSPAGALAVTAVLTYFLVAPQLRKECLESAVRRSASLLFIIGSASALGTMLATVLPLAKLASTFATHYSNFALIFILFAITAIFKVINGSSLATFAAVPPILAHVVSGASLDPTIAVYAICLGAFVAILPNDSYFWLTQPRANTEGQTQPPNFTFTVASIVQALVGLACLYAYAFVIQ
ncbi:arsinothricin export permease ArsQ [Burkholderia cepacia]|uniref:arsinothricin export permease ArsQ n=1 Tax=Burkholderia cepacia TaxID=292 RepID=UPI000A796D75|nr:arsinothricin export permease ArsQ [Burkholderia cepacia]